MRFRIIAYSATVGAAVGGGLSIFFNGIDYVPGIVANAFIGGAYFGVVGILIAVAEYQRRKNPDSK
jgi:hypothetical protein